VVRVADMLPRTDHGFISPFCEYCQRCSVSPQCVVPPPPAAPKPPQGQFAAAGRHAAPPPLVEPQAVAAAASTPVMICERCHGEMSEWTYWSVLKLVDDSASIGALLYRDAGEVFFDGVKASRLRHDRSRLTKLRTHLQTLLQPLRFSDGGRAQGTGLSCESLPEVVLCCAAGGQKACERTEAAGVLSDLRLIDHCQPGQRTTRGEAAAT
jgi:hypothetical protein